MVLVACGPQGPEGASPPDAADAPVVPDASGGGGPADARPPAVDAARVECPPGLPASFGDLGTVVANKNDVSGTYNVFVDLDGDPRWFFGMKLRPGSGIFEGGVVPGTYVLEGDDTDVQFCSACLNLFADLDSVEGGPSLHMTALKGSLTIDSVVGDEVSGRLDDVLLSAIRIVYDEQGIACTPNADGTVNDVPECVNTICLSGHCGRQIELAGCQTSIARMRF